MRRAESDRLARAAFETVDLVTALSDSPHKLPRSSLIRMIPRLSWRIGGDDSVRTRSQRYQRRLRREVHNGNRKTSFEMGMSVCRPLLYASSRRCTMRCRVRPYADNRVALFIGTATYGHRTVPSLKEHHTSPVPAVVDNTFVFFKSADERQVRPEDTGDSTRNAVDPMRRG